MALVRSTPAVKLKTSAVRQIASLSPTPSVTQGILEAAREVEGSNAHIVFVGPTKAGKSTLINAMLGCLAVPTGALPNTLLPVSFYSDGADDRCYAVYLEGEGLDEFLGIESEFSKLNSEAAFKKVAEINAQARVAMQAVDDFEQLLDRFPSLCGWHLEVNVPNAERGLHLPSAQGLHLPPVTLTDCPGGSEGGVIGMAVQAFLAHQVESSALNVLVVRADNITALQTPYRVASFFGGRISSCACSEDSDCDLRPPTLLVVNGMMDTATRHGIEEMFAGAAIQESLRSLDIVRTFFLNALTLLAHRLCNRILDAVHEKRPCSRSRSGSAAGSGVGDDPEVTGGDGSLAAPSAQSGISEFLQACGLGSFTALLAEQGIEEIDFLLSLDEEDIVEVARDVGMKPMQVKQFMKLWASLRREGGALAGADSGATAASASPELPAFATPQFERFQPELTVIFNACCLDADLEDEFDEGRKSFPGRLERALGRGHTDESAFDELFVRHLDVIWPEMLTTSMLIKCLKMATHDAERRKSQAQAAAMPAEEALLQRQIFADVSLEMGLPDNFGAIQRYVEQELLFLSDVSKAKEAMTRASRLLGDETEGGDLNALVVEQATDREFAIAWEANVGEAVLSRSILGKSLDQNYTHGRRVMPNRENARALVNAYNDWCCRRIDKAILFGRVPTESAGRWLSSRLPQYAEMVCTLPAPNRSGLNIVRPHLPKSKRNMRSQLFRGVSQEWTEIPGMPDMLAQFRMQDDSKDKMGAWTDDDVFIMGTGCQESSFFKKPVLDQDGELQPVHGRHKFNVVLLPSDWWAAIANHAASQFIHQYSALASKAAQQRLDDLISDTDDLASGLLVNAQSAAGKSEKANEVVERLQALRHADRPKGSETL